MTDITTHSRNERRLVGTLLVSPESLSPIAARLDQLRFSDSKLQTIYTALRALGDRAQCAADVVDALERKRQIADAGGADHVFQLIGEPGATDSRSLPSVVDRFEADYAVRVAAAGVAHQLADLNSGGDVDPSALVRRFTDHVAPLHNLSADEFESIDTAFDEVVHYFEHPMESAGLPTSILELDELTGGLRPGELFVIAAPTSGGKSAMGGQVVAHAAHVAKNNPGGFGAPEGKVGPAVVFSFEMKRKQIVQRWVAQCSSVEKPFSRRTGWSAADKPIALDGLRRVTELPMKVVNNGHRTVEELRAAVERMIFRNGVKPSLVAVDHIGLMNAPHTKSKNEAQAHIANELKAMALELEIPVIALVQLNREASKREGHRPTMFDLRDSGEIENSADVVVLIYRQDYYLEESEQQKMETAPAELIVAKNRDGRRGVVHVTWMGRRTLFIPDPAYEPEGGLTELDREQGVIHFPKVVSNETLTTQGLAVKQQLLLTPEDLSDHCRAVGGATKADLSRELDRSRSVIDATVKAAVEAGYISLDPNTNKYLDTGLNAADAQIPDLPF